MRYIILAILLILTSCQLFAQNHNYKGIWDYNPAEDQVTYYNVFLVELDDTLSCPLIDGIAVTQSLIDNYRIDSPSESSLRLNDPTEARILFSSDENGKWLRLGVSAVNTNGESVLAVSPFFKKDFKLIPGKPSVKRIEY